MATTISGTTLTIPNEGVSALALGNGGIVQVVQTIKTDAWSQSTTNQTFYNPTNFSRTITPTTNTNKILLIAACAFSIETNYEMGAKFTRTVGGVEAEVFRADADGSRTRAYMSDRTNSGADYCPITMIYLDSPNTTSEITYKVQIGAEASSEVYLNRHHGDSNAAGDFRGSSNIICMEVVA